MSDLLPLGKILTTEEHRDAIHIAVAPVTASATLSPGDRIGFMSDGTVDSTAEVIIGIVDPFLTRRVSKGERFYLFLFPNTITSLRHDWTHPAFEQHRDTPEAATTKSRIQHQQDSLKWLTAHAELLDITYSALMRDAKTWLEYEDHTVQHGSEHWRDMFGDPVEFWHHYEIVTGEVVPEDRKRSFYCCSC